MPRKIFICFFVVLLMTTMVVPAFASSPAGDTTAKVHSPAVVIDYIRYLNGANAGAICDWPNNFSAGGSLTGAIGNDVFNFASYYSDGRFFTTIRPFDCSYVRLFCSSYFWAEDQHFIIDCGQSDVVFSSVSISGKFVYFSSVNGQYFMRTESFSNRASVYADTIYVDDLIGAAISDFSWSGPAPYLQDVVIEFSFYNSDPNYDPEIRTVIASSSSPSSYFEGWFNYQQLPSSGSGGSGGVVEDVGMFDWLLDSVNAFLNFEIAPEFSLNRIFLIVLVIGVLLWFITLLI